MIVSNTLHEVLSARFPSVDFVPYFAFLESLTPPESGGHKHHILPKKEFPEFAKDLNNLVRLSPADHFRAHYWLACCAPDHEPFQRVFYLMANRKRVYQIDKNELPRYAELYAHGRTTAVERMSEIGKVQGKIQGLKSVKNGRLASYRTPEHQQEAGRASGQKNVESGWIQELGKSQGAKNTKNGHLANLRTPEHQRKAQQAAGQANIKSGWARKWGGAQGQENVRNGHLASLRTVEHQSAAGKTGNHIRWHSKRNLVIPTCALCLRGVQI